MIKQLRKYFLIAVACCVIISCNDDPEPTLTFRLEVSVYNQATKTFQLAPATLVVSAGGEDIVTKDLAGETSTINAPAREGNYTVIVSKTGYLTFEKEFTQSELSQYIITPVIVFLLDESVTEGMVAFYPFNASANDSTTNHRDGVVHGPSPTNDRKGNANSAYFFDGQDDYISVANHASLNPTGDFTISLWASVSSTQVPQGGTNDLLRKWNENTDGYPFSISYNNAMAASEQNKINFARYDGQGCANLPSSYSPVITNDQFVHFVLVKQGTKLRHYLNGALTQEFTDNTSCATSNSADLTIGCRGNLSHFFKGKIDDIRIYGRAITDAEVASLFVE